MSLDICWNIMLLMRRLENINTPRINQCSLRVYPASRIVCSEKMPYDEMVYTLAHVANKSLKQL
jgi:hypothetical protein